MELYDFINNDLPELFKKNEGADAVDHLQNEGGSVIAEREILLERVVSLEKERDDLGTKLQVVETDRERILGRIASIEKHAATLERERSDLEMQMQAWSSEKASALREANAMLKEKSSEIEQLRMNLSGLQQRLSETLALMEQVETEKIAYRTELKIARQDLSVSIQKAKRASVIACITVLVLVAGLLIYSTKSRTVQPKPAVPQASTDNRIAGADAGRNLPGSGSSVPQTQVRIGDPVDARWPRRPIAMTVGNFRVSVISLKSGIANRLPVALKHEGTETSHYYIVKIRAPKEELSSEFIKSPSIDFIDKNNASALQAGAVSVLRVVHESVSRRRRVNNGIVLLRCLVSIRNDFQPIGIIIGPLNKETLRIVIV